jgi:IS30 family transposase
MDAAQRAILDSLPPPPRRRSKLDPHAALIRALRARGQSYRDIVTILSERSAVRVATHTLYRFVQRIQQNARPRSTRRRAAPATRSFLKASPSERPASPEAESAVRARIAAVKQRASTTVGEPKMFTYDENEPLHVITPVPPQKKR